MHICYLYLHLWDGGLYNQAKNTSIGPLSNLDVTKGHWNLFVVLKNLKIVQGLTLDYINSEVPRKIYQIGKTLTRQWHNR